jgi:hypothetical protein
MTTTTQLPLNSQAQAMLQAFQRQAGVLPSSVEAAVAQQASQATQATAPAGAVTQGTAVALDCDALEKILLAAMPDQKQAIVDAKGRGATYHCDKTNGRFLTQILSMRIEKETHNAYAPPAPTPPRVNDPLYATFTMAPDADVMLLFNARDVDDKGQPLLMKVVARERVDVSTLDLSTYRMHPGTTTPDVVRVKDGASYVETKDINEHEFSFGDPLKQVSLNGKGREISTSVWVRPDNVDKQLFFRAARGPTGNFVADVNQPVPQFNMTSTGDNLDRTPVKSFAERIRVSLQTANLPRGAWLDTANVGSAVKASLAVDRGYIFEPGSQGTVNIGGNASGGVTVTVPKDDAHLLGNGAIVTPLTVQPGATLRSVLGATLSQRTSAQAAGSDVDTASKALHQIIFADAASRTVAGRALAPMRDVKLTAGELAAAKMSCTAKPLPRDPEEDGVTVSLTLDDAFLAAAAGKDTSFKGYQMVVGFTDVDGSWQEQARTVNSAASKKEAFSFDCNDFDGLQKKDANLEVRLFTADGIPAHRVLVPFREVFWGA